MTAREPLSKGWIVGSYVLFLLVEVALGTVLAPLISGFVSRAMALRVEVILILGSYYAGGYLVGLLSPKVRLTEPALAAALAVVTTFLYSVFTPLSFYRMDPTKLAIACIVAFFVALVGADGGERTAARLGNDASRRHVGGDGPGPAR